METYKLISGFLEATDLDPIWRTLAKKKGENLKFNVITFPNSLEILGKPREGKYVKFSSNSDRGKNRDNRITGYRKFQG